MESCEPEMQRGGAIRDKPSSSASETMEAEISKPHRDRPATKDASGIYQNRGRTMQRQGRPSTHTTSNHYQSVEYYTSSASFASQQRTVVYQPPQAYLPRRSEYFDLFQSGVQCQNTSPRGISRQKIQAQNRNQMAHSYSNSQQSSQLSLYQNSGQPHRQPHDPQSYQSHEQNPFQQWGQYSQPYHAYDQNQNFQSGVQYSQPNMKPRSQNPHQGHISRGSNNSQQSNRSEPVYHYVPSDQQAQSYQKVQPNMTLERYTYAQQHPYQQAKSNVGSEGYPYAQQQPKQQARAYQAPQAENYPPQGYQISSYGPHRLRRIAAETPEHREHNDGIQAKIDELIRKDAEAQAQKSKLLMTRLMEQQELGQQVLENRLKQKCVTPDMSAQAYATEMQKFQRKQEQSHFQSHRGCFDGGRRRKRGGRDGGGMGGAAARLVRGNI